MKYEKLITVFILSRDRPKLILETIQSILNQTYKNFKIVVSDNSVQNEVENLLRETYPSIEYVRRKNLTIPEHLEEILREVNTKYFVMFHDDDRMHLNYLEQMVSVMETTQNIVAVGCNAEILLDSVETGRSYMTKPIKQFSIQTPESLVKNYLTFFSNIAPFPSYFYCASKVKGIYPKNSEGGKWADVSFLMKISGRGTILWLGQPLMDLRYHSQNHSGIENIAERLSLLRFIYRHTTLTRHSVEVCQYRLFYWLCWFRTHSYWFKDSRRSRKMFAALHYVIKNTLYLILTRPSIWIGLWKKTVAKIAKGLNA